MSQPREHQQGPEPSAGGPGRVVVGIDGSSGSRLALEAALRSADRRGDRLQVIMAYMPEDAYGAWGNGAWAAVPSPDPQRVRDSARDIAERMVKDVLADRAAELRTEPDIDVEVRAGRAAGVLLEAARDADELFVGHRGRGAVRSLMLGSVGLHCVANAPCPVTVVPPEDVAS